MTATAERRTIVSGGPRPARGTLTQLFFDAVQRHNKPDALQVKVNGAWQPISHRTMAERVRRVALGLESLGVTEGSRVAILSENRPEWAIADFGCLTAAIADVPIYPTLPAEQIEFLLRDSASAAIFVSTAAQAAKIAQIRGNLPSLRHVIIFDEGSVPGVDMSMAALEARGAAAETEESIAAYRERALAVQPEDLATIIYTSGTTGEPKGTMLTHDNIWSNVAASSAAIPFVADDVALSFLPLSHIFERMAGHYMTQHVGVSIAYAESIDTVPQNMLEVRPTIVLAVPRLYEKIYARVLEGALSGGAIKKRIFFWARSVADRYADERLAGREPSGWLTRQYGIANKLVFSKLRDRTGGRIRYFVSGGAPLAPEINKFFYAAGLVILEGYGLTETSPVIAVNTPQNFRIGTVGKPIPGVEVAIAEDGEILTRGPHVMKGYYNKPDATREVMDGDGWFHTGDIGVLEKGDFLRITDRKKDLIVTAAGKNIAPQPVENAVKTNKYVSQAVMIGDRRKYPIVLIVPNFETLEAWAKRRSLTWSGQAGLVALPEVQAKMEREVLGQLTGLASFETPKKVVLLDQDFTIESGELTPKLSVKRRVVDEKHRERIDAVYAEDGGALPR